VLYNNSSSRYRTRSKKASKKERMKERKKEKRKKERRILRLKVVFVDVISIWSVSMLTDGYVCPFSTALLRNQHIPNPAMLLIIFVCLNSRV
jgi:hypothetical protein